MPPGVREMNTRTRPIGKAIMAVVGRFAFCKAWKKSLEAE